MPKVLVTGGTGFVGQAVVRRLLALGCEVRLLARSEPKRTAPAGVEIVAGEIDDAAALDRACAGVQAVVHLVGIIAEKGDQTFERVHVGGTRAVVAAARKAGVRRCLHMSALGARPDSPARYSRTKAEAEALVRESGLDWTIFRPSIVFGPGDRFVSTFAALFRFPWSWLQLHSFPLIGGGRTRLQPVSVDDVAAAFAGALSHAGSVGKAYDLVGIEALPLREILRETAAAVGVRTVADGTVPLRFMGRILAWAVAGLVPLLFLAAAARTAFSLHPDAALWTRPGEPVRVLAFAGVRASPAFWPFVVLWLAAVAVALRWRTLILFPLQWWEAFLVARLLQRLPGAPLTVDQVAMLRSDNTGDPAPAIAAFGLALTPFRQGIRAYLRP